MRAETWARRAEMCRMIVSMLRASVRPLRERRAIAHEEAIAKPRKAALRPPAAFLLPTEVVHALTAASPSPSTIQRRSYCPVYGDSTCSSSQTSAFELLSDAALQTPLVPASEGFRDVPASVVQETLVACTPPVSAVRRLLQCATRRHAVRVWTMRTSAESR